MTPTTPSTESPATRLQRIHERKLKVHAAFAKLDHALTTGELSTAEYTYYIERIYGGKQEHDLLRDLNEEEQRIQAGVLAARKHSRTRLPAVATLLALVLFAGMGSILLFSRAASPLAGLVATEPSAQHEQLFDVALNKSTNLSLDATNITDLRIIGSLASGTADVYLVADGDLLVKNGSGAIVATIAKNGTITLGADLVTGGFS